MKLTIRIRVLPIAQAQFVYIPCFQILLSFRARKVIVIHKVVTRVVRWVDVNHFYPPI